MFHISDIKKYNRCDRYFYLNQLAPKPYFPFATCNESTLELAKQFLNCTEYYEGKSGDAGELVLAQLDHYDTFVAARFTYQDLRVTIPFLRKQQDGYQVIFTNNQCFPKESEAAYLAIACWVLKQNGIQVNDVKMIHLAADYVREETLDVFKVLMLDDYLYHDKKQTHKTIFEIISEQKLDVDNLLVGMRSALAEYPEGKQRSSVCTHRGKCDYFDRCFNQEEKPDSVYNLVQSGMKYDLVDAGKTELGMLDGDDIEGTRHQYAQIMAARSESGLYFDVFAMRDWVKRRIQYPITYLDFEWETYVYPPYQGMKPYDVLVFQYSMHVENTPGAPLLHEQFIGTGDCRVAFIEDLLAKIPAEGSVMVYNAVGAEMLRLKQLAVQFPQYSERLKAIWERMVDLSLPFSTGNIYDVRMAGAYSLKKLVEIFTDYDYHDLSISHGMEAVANWRSLQTDEINDEIREQLYEYCGMDTYSMVLVYHMILDVLKKYE
ncbi:DUF2779 domain-containing protein [Dielma fastidiosa]|uniref:DUF2779 domain-containing protein n=1 Tax=Dielma fastidiosa TaxID=1034346 RepID=UPI000E4C3666|nr:DUF2779 domain-containing protein [Dielma fastidiosa]RHN03234.1 DUF2779 domain-containing protein [Dielma fastidiosa]